MSFDKIFRADSQKFVGPPLVFSEFRDRAIEARDGMETAMDATRDNDLAARFAKKANISVELSRNIFQDIELEIEGMRDPWSIFNFDIDQGMDEQVLERQNSRILELTQQERERRLNKQNKSIALRAMRYDFVDHHLLTTKTMQKSHLLEAWAASLREVKQERRPETEIGTMAPFEGNGQESTKEEIDHFLNPPEGSRRSQFLPWGKDDIVVDVSIYLGYNRTLEYHEIRLGRLMKVTDKLLALGHNTLDQIKDSFHCPSDYMILDDVSNRDITQDDICKYRFPSSFFFIHDTFYLDMRPAGAIDISEPIRKWAAKRGITDLKVAYMEKTRLIDLHCRLGQPYVYVHQGTCEHLVCFTDLHLRSLSDQPGPYPLVLKEHVFRRITCAACQADAADWSVMHCKLLPGTPVYLCSICYREFLFYEANRKACEFIAVPSFDRKAMDSSGRFLHKFEIKPSCKKVDKKDTTLEPTEKAQEEGENPFRLPLEDSEPVLPTAEASRGSMEEAEACEHEKETERIKKNAAELDDEDWYRPNCDMVDEEIDVEN